MNKEVIIGGLNAILTIIVLGYLLTFPEKKGAY